MLKTTLEKMLLEEHESHEPNGVKIAVIEDILDCEGMENYIRDIIRHGCSGGSVSRLIYYADTHEFFDEHADSIADYVTEYQDETGEALRIDGDMKNFYAWFSYEWAMNDLYHQIGSEELIDY